MQYVRLIPILEKASNIEDNIIFSIEEVIKYNHAAEILDPKKLKTIKIKMFTYLSYIILCIYPIMA